MNYTQIKLVVALVFLLFSYIACAPETQEKDTPPKNVLEEVNIHDRQLINHQQLLDWQKDSLPIVLIDTRPDSSFQKGHLAAAVSLWRPDIQSTLFPYKGMMLEKEALERLLGDLGATSKSIFVLYDNSGNTDAARLWWILTTYGHSKAYLLNGGLQSASKELITQEQTKPVSANFSFAGNTKTNLKANKEDVLAAISDSNIVLLDCRTTDEFTGKKIKKNAFRGGHIPSAIHLNYIHTIAYHQAYQFKPDQELDSIFRAIPRDKKIIVYCQSGVRSAHTTFVLHKLLGYPNVANYDDSWIEWSYDKALPVALGLD